MKNNGNDNTNDDSPTNSTTSNIGTENENPNETAYQKALSLFAQDKYGEAYQTMKSINGYKDSAEKADSISSSVKS